MVLAPQLRQSLEMLQLPLMGVRAMTSRDGHNPTIEDVVSPHEALDDLAAHRQRGTAAARARTRKRAGSRPARDEKPLDFDERNIDTLTAMDDEWRDYYFDEQQNNPYTVQDGSGCMFDSLRQPVSLQHLLEQLRMTDLGKPAARRADVAASTTTAPGDRPGRTGGAGGTARAHRDVLR